LIDQEAASALSKSMGVIRTIRPSFT
jgi:hypothetical protein